MYKIMNGKCKTFEAVTAIEKYFFYIAGPFMAVITGWDGIISRSDAQVIYVGSSSSGCRLLTNYPTTIKHASGGLIANELIICGGDASGSYQTACYKYSTSEHQWTIFAHLQTARGYHATTPLDDNQMWITGKPYFSYDSVRFYNNGC